MEDLPPAAAAQYRVKAHLFLGNVHRELSLIVFSCCFGLQM